jgi:rhodanese-related sulfurtransferase
MVKKCLDCKSKLIDDLESDMENVVPLWYKKQGNYSLLPKALNCDNKYNPQKVDLKESTPEITDTEVKVSVKTKKDTWVFYWASQPQKDSKKINGPAEAYGKEKNSGLLKTGKKGEVDLVLNCPQPYKVDSITYPRHVHYVTLTDDEVWDTDVKTMVVTCHLTKDDLKDVLKAKTHFVINALPEISHSEKSIPDSLNLPVEDVTEKNRDKKIKDFIEDNIEHYPDLKELVNKKKLQLKDVPIVVYCANKECNASHNLLQHMMNSGFSNVLEYPGGVKEWFDEEKKQKSLTFYDEESSLTDDIYDLDITKEKIVIDGIIYTHDMDNQELYDNDDELIGLWDGKKVKWESEDDEAKHKKRIMSGEKKEGTEVIEDGKEIKKSKREKKKTKDPEDDPEDAEEEEDDPDDPEDAEEEEDEPEDAEEEEDDPEDAEEEEDDPEDDPEDNKKGTKSNEKSLIDDKLKQLKDLLSNGLNGGGITEGGQKSNKNEQESKKDGVYLKDNSSLSEKKFNEKFRGWGFTFF